MTSSSLSFADFVLFTIYGLLVVALGAVVWSMVRGRRVAPTHWAMPQWLAVGLLAGSLAVTFLLGSSEPLSVNGRPFSDALWLRLSDMFINTSVFLIVVCSVLIVVARFRR